MTMRQSTLIQSIAEYKGLLDPHLSGFREYRMNNVRGKDEIIRWIIEEELELIYGLFSVEHIHNHDIFRGIHNKLELSLPQRLSEITKRYILLPRAFYDTTRRYADAFNNLIDMRDNIDVIPIGNDDLVINYYITLTNRD